MTTEDAIRHALDDIARLAPDPSRLRSRLAGRIRSARQRRLLLIAGAATAGTAAVGVPGALWLTRRAPGPTDANLPTPATEPTHPGNLRAPMRLRPTWLPEGVFEFSREASVAGPHQQRIWTSAKAIALLHRGELEQALGEPIVSLQISHPVAFVAPTPAVIDPASPPVSPQPFYPLGGPANTTIGGRQGRLGRETNGQAGIAWELGDGIVASLGITAVPDPTTTVARIARSMVPDGAAVCELALRLGYLPPGADLSSELITVSGWNGGWTQILELSRNNGIGTGVRVFLATSRDLLSDTSLSDNDDPATVLGRPGKIGARGGYAEALVELDGGRWVQVVSYFGSSNAENVEYVTRIANAIVIGPDPYLGWIGTR